MEDVSMFLLSSRSSRHCSPWVGWSGICHRNSPAGG